MTLVVLMIHVQERRRKKVNIKFDLAEGKKKSSENWVNEQFCGHDKMPGSKKALL